MDCGADGDAGDGHVHEARGLLDVVVVAESQPLGGDTRADGERTATSVTELARLQGVKPANRIEDLYGKGQPADWDGFDEALAQWRAEHPVV